VDDILLIDNDILTLDEVKSSLNKVFSIKDLDEIIYIFGIKIYRDRSQKLIELSQGTYIDKMLKRFNMHNSKKENLLISHNIDLGKKHCLSTNAELETMKKLQYTSAIESIMYAMICTRPDVSYTLSVTSRHQANLNITHSTAVKTILKYLRRTKNIFFIYGDETELVIRDYTDVSFQTDRDDLRSQSGFMFILNGDAVSWKSSK
jgi:Reverse transcriptase (RNA-dependent DNA polymerase)